MKPRILQSARLMPALEARLRSEFEAHPLWNEPDPAAFLEARGGEFEILVTNATAGASASMMDALPALKAICSLGVGCDAIDLQAARERGVVVANTPDVLTDCVADIAMGLLIDVARGLSAADRHVRRGKWLEGPFPLTTRVTGKRLGILGLGRIGQAVARRARGFEMQLRYHSRRPVASSNLVYEPSLVQLAQWADFLVVACSGGAATQGLVSEAVLRALGPQGFLVNVARGSVVDEAALVRALQQGTIAGAGLDVYADEPNVPPALIALENAVLLPHMASGTRETRQAMADLVFENVQSFVEHGRLKTPVPA
ncbi:MAG TPA: 2-hydroxyacid dehydrogenase [Plasticicumulans sp.]|nr:MAG: 2-hydroxyacid dehydrogenase [Burkholderiaceae bacterium]HMZ10283.1 2-hydroxyacid dehydrogenase [Plasticicumulans sp.]HNE00073.1 2-hydroxyacid dehydrogenase [Plasticicumulans sp.]HNO59018.1 2-hydroxyacid dehydrogenase [Plasticicumulans sp.]